jgi:hypothetical protein
MRKAVLRSVHVQVLVQVLEQRFPRYNAGNSDVFDGALRQYGLHGGTLEV